MIRNVEDTQIVFIGAGNVATCLAHAFYGKGFCITQVYSRTETAARELAKRVAADYTDNINKVTKQADVYIVSVSDSAYATLLPQLVKGREKALWVHTAGSIPLAVFDGIAERCGVLYPLQTFSRQRAVMFGEVPFFIEAKHAEDEEVLTEMAQTLSQHVYSISSDKRMELHLAAVFVNNFTNFLFSIADDILSKKQLPFKVLQPLINETISKIYRLSPRDAQTGPAVRQDNNVMEKHLAMLADNPMFQEIYRLMSKSIYEHHQL